MILNANIYGGDSTTIEPLSVTENGTYTASSGTAYSPVTVNVGGEDSDIDKIAMNLLSGQISGNASFIALEAFRGWYGIKTANFPLCTDIKSGAFSGCRSLTAAYFSTCEIIRNQVFNYCEFLSDISFPMCKSIGASAFYNCSITTASFPECTSIAASAFTACTHMSEAYFPKCINIGQTAFSTCTSLATVHLPKCTSIGQSAFKNCQRLLSLYLDEVTAVPTINTSTFESTPIKGYTTQTGGVYGSVFVPASLYQSFLTANYWSSISARIVSVP